MGIACRLTLAGRCIKDYSYSILEFVGSLRGKKNKTLNDAKKHLIFPTRVAFAVSKHEQTF